MTDIVERLRSWIPESEFSAEYDYSLRSEKGISKMIEGAERKEAADEIERLRRALLQIRSYIDCPEHYNKHIDNIIDAAVGPEMPIFTEGCDNLSGYKLEGKP